MAFEIILLVITGVFTALLAGLFYGYAVSVNRGLGLLKDSEYVAAMKSINIVIQNPLFFLSFFGSVILLPLITFLSWGDAGSVRFTLLLIASGFFIIGSFVVTVAGNVPLNEKLARLDLSHASVQKIAKKARRLYEEPWNRLHTIRTLTSIVATTLIF